MLTIDFLRPGDLGKTVQLHHDHLDLGLFPKLGPGFLRLYQQSFAESPYGLALVARQDGRVKGALFGTSSNARHYDWVLRNRWHELATRGVLGLASRPDVALFFLRTRLIRYARGITRRVTAKPRATGPGAPLSVLSHIATSADSRGRGIGRRLVERFRRLASAHGAHEASLVTREGGLGQGFFDHLGCTCVAHRQGSDHEAICEYHLSLEEPLNGWSDTWAADRADRTGVRHRGERATADFELDAAR